MRNLIENPNISINATPYYHFRGDLVFYDIFAKRGGDIKVRIEVAGEVLNAKSDGDKLRVYMTDVVNKNRNGEIAITIHYSVSGASGEIVDSICIAFGKSLPQRTHGAVTDIEIPRLTGIVTEVFALGKCSVENGRYQTLADDVGVVSLGATGAKHYTITQSYYANQKIGDIVEGVEITQKHKIKVRYTCPQKGDVVLRYCDADGCTRYAVGKMIEDTFEVNSLEYDASETEMSSIFERKVIGGNQTIKLGFADVPRGQYLEDVLISDEVMLADADGQIIARVVPTSSSMTRGNDAEDIYITFKLIEL